MSGISSTTGLISGIDTASLINQLLALEARPRTLLQQRIIQLQAQQSAYLDINSKLASLRSAATAFGTQRIFGSARAGTSNEDVLTATAAAGAAVGSYSFLVDRLVSTQQQLSRGFPDRSSTAAGATSFTFESAEGRLDRDTELSVLNGGSGISRGSIDITDAAGNTAVVDLSRVSTVDEVIEAINSAEGVNVTASVEGNHFVVTNNAAGAGGVVIRNHGSSTTAASLGILHATDNGATTVTGSAVHSVVGATSLQSLNDGNGVRLSSTGGTDPHDFTVTITNGVDTRTINVYLGEVRDDEDVVTTARASTVQNVLDRVNASGTESGTSYLTASISSDGGGLTLDTPDGYTITSVDDVSGAAEDLGIGGTPGTNSLAGTRVLAGLNSTLISNILGGDGLGSGGIHIELHDGVSAFDISLENNGSVSDLLSQLNSLDPTKIRASLNSTGTGLTITDLTIGSGTLNISGAQAEALGLATPTGVTEASVDSDRLQHRYVSSGTSLTSINGGRGVGTGRFEITDSNGNVSVVDIGSDSRTIGDIVSEINSRPINILARVNDNGDGIIIEEDTPLTGGSHQLTIRDLSGSVARNLNIAGEAEDGGDNNFIDGSFEHVVEFAAGDTLDDITRKVNDANVGVRATVINDGSVNSPYHLSFTSDRSGRAGRYTLDAGGVDLGLSTLAQGSDARVFYGSSDPASAVLLTSSTNDLDGLITGVNIDLHSTSETPVNLTISSDTSAIETAVGTFVTAYNTLVGRIDTLSSYDAETERRGTLLGDSTTQLIRQQMFGAVTGRATGVSGPYQYLSQVGIKFDREGNLTVDSEDFQAALQANPQAVADLLSAKVQNTRPATTEIPDIPGVTVRNTSPDTYTSLGIFEKIGQAVDRYLDRSDGVLTRRKTTLDNQIAAQNDRIGQLDERLDRRREFLQRQFQGMETALAQLQSQQSAISGIRGLTG